VTEPSGSGQPDANDNPDWYSHSLTRFFKSHRLGDAVVPKQAVGLLPEFLGNTLCPLKVAHRRIHYHRIIQALSSLPDHFSANDGHLHPDVFYLLRGHPGRVVTQDRHISQLTRGD
jgi:hypothetical protein